MLDKPVNIYSADKIGFSVSSEQQKSLLTGKDPGMARMEKTLINEKLIVLQMGKIFPKIMKHDGPLNFSQYLLIFLHFPQPSVTFSPLWSKEFPQYPVLQHPQPIFCPQYKISRLTLVQNRQNHNSVY